MGNSIGKVVFCAVVSMSMVASSWASGGASWYSPLFSELEDGEILEISLQCEDGEEVQSKSFIDPDNRELSVQVPEGADLTALVPEFEVSEGFVVVPEAGVARDFSEAVDYTLRCESTDRSFQWRISVFDADTGIIFTGEDFKDWKIRSHGYDLQQHFGDYIDNRDGLFARLDHPVESGSWTLFYHENDRPIRRVEFKHYQPVDHHRNVSLQILDLSGVDPEALAEEDWPQEGLDATGRQVRWNRSLSEVTGIMRNRADFSGDPVHGPIALKYGGAVQGTWNYRVHIKAMMLLFE